MASVWVTLELCQEVSEKPLLLGGVLKLPLRRLRCHDSEVECPGRGFRTDDRDQHTHVSVYSWFSKPRHMLSPKSWLFSCKRSDRGPAGRLQLQASNLSSRSPSCVVPFTTLLHTFELLGMNTSLFLVNKATCERL